MRTWGKKFEEDALAAAREKEAKKAEERETQLRIKKDLDEQMKARAKAKAVVLMTAEEKEYNTKLLENVHKFRSTGRIGTGQRAGILG